MKYNQFITTESIEKKPFTGNNQTLNVNRV